jgi:hypothetical protein
MDYQELRACEPRVRELKRFVLAIKPGPRFCANETFYNGGLRLWLEFIERQYGFDAHGAATSVLFGMLPNCRRDCKCSRGD